MRYKLKPKKKKPEIGDLRLVRKFALFPICLQREIRWLEWCTIKQMYGWAGWADWLFVDEED